MDRPEQHVTDSKGETQLRRVIDALGWTGTKIAADYGIDWDIEVFQNGKTTGITFKVQLKSSTATSYSADGDFVSQPLPTKNARYLIHEMQTPTIVIHADVANSRTFWVAPQLEVEIAERTKDESDGKTLTFRLPTANSLPETADPLLLAVGRAKVLLATHTIARAPVNDFVATLVDQPDAAAMAAALRSKADVLESQRAFQLMWANQLDESERVLRALWNDERTSVETKFSAALTWEQVDIRRAIHLRQSDQERDAAKLRTADRLDSLVPHGPPELEIYASVFRKVTELDVLLRENWGILLRLYLATQAGIDAISAAEISFRLADVTTRLGRKIEECYQLVNSAAHSRYGYVLADPVVRLGKSIFLLAGQYRSVGFEPGNLSDQAFELFRFAAALAKRTGDQQRLGDAIGAARLISGDRDSPSFRWLTEQLTLVTDLKIKGAVEDLLDRLQRRENGEELPNTIQTTERQILENLATGVGVDLNDATNPTARAIRAGIDDHDPTRVLRDCEHLVVAGDTPAVMVGGIPLPVAAPRTIRCAKFGYEKARPSLDKAYGAFKPAHCTNCPAVSPRAADWQYFDE